ncbi:gliding motility-associated C-terminal domain-containing protein [Tenacibaculum sp. SZ-18]|uniref:gliding motility-associated C-terminal domain-containing protein n=1 Tax=Tenacibaculum sp. SZ-18 TaxID=754423 RepID=UPI0018E28B07|nr:gliding motility-associated C-terminal domain-containing protein [Tenacibaculum sp. SZ-18]
MMIIFVSSANAQSAFKNFGSIQMHSNASIGFHTDLINDGDFENNEGLAGFYSESDLRIVSGTNRIAFYNVEIDAINDVNIETSLGVTNELEFINGRVNTPRSNTTISLDFINHNLYAGEDDDRHINGYASVLGTDEFIFPIGNDDRLRPMITPALTTETLFSGAYFFENPNLPSTFSSNFNTDDKEEILKNISNNEYWDLDGTTETTVTLTWDTFSNIENISPLLRFLRVVGWSKAENKWINLGGVDIQGDLTEGRITSLNFIPDNYEVITIGSIFSDIELGGSDNYLISPNEDGTNDNLVFDGLELYEQNELVVFNRWGNVVFRKKNYENNWSAFSNGRATIKKGDKLPTGTYFYTLKFGNQDLDRTKKGWVYISY